MSDEINALIRREYEAGFVTNIESETLPPGLNEEVVRVISAKKNEPEWMLEWRLEAYRKWREMEIPTWAHLKHPPVDFDAISYYSSPKSKNDGPKSLDEVDPEILETFEKLGIPLHERAKLAGVAVDAVFDSVSIGTTFKDDLAKAGVIFCSISEAIRDYPELIQKYLGSVVPQQDNFYAALNSAVFSDGSFVYIPKNTRCPMELSTYFRINELNTGQFERTLIVADEGSQVSYLEGCTAPMRDENQLHAAVVELVALGNADIKYSTVQNWYPGDENGKGGIYNFVTKRGVCDGAVGLVIHLVERHACDGILLVPRSHQRRHGARSGECGIGRRTRRIGIQPRCRDATHTPVDNVRRQSVADRGGGHRRRGQISRHKLRIGRIG